jgi:ATP-dependent DNA ligase
MLTRKGLDWTERFAPIAQALAKLPARAAYLDGEIVVLGKDGISSFVNRGIRLVALPITSSISCGQ